MKQRSPLHLLRSVLGALIFIGATVTLAKVAQYAAVDQLGGALGFTLASLIGAAPVVVAAAIVRRWAQRSGLIDKTGGQPSR
ncbi:hypothetical protein SAMN05216382_0552 [Sphingomonas palmae]|uniref:Uncharacterized protein n=1 Tax=Sphingomonas palmae TaxID=1855283 RepID=A0A1H7HM61_9SPHN|nr:hypothetical protein [Sphingomonas palmae]SEK51351.1 hypothetical protein SAMN05216382_0552 [Sphingomonas palmae]